MPMLLESFGEWQLDEKAELQLVVTLENPDIPCVDKVCVLWQQPHAGQTRHQLQKWIDLRDVWVQYLCFHRDVAWPHADGHSGE